MGSCHCNIVRFSTQISFSAQNVSQSQLWIGISKTKLSKLSLNPQAGKWPQPFCFLGITKREHREHIPAGKLAAFVGTNHPTQLQSCYLTPAEVSRAEIKAQLKTALNPLSPKARVFFSSCQHYSLPCNATYFCAAASLPGLSSVPACPRLTTSTSVHNKKTCNPPPPCAAHLPPTANIRKHRNRSGYWFGAAEAGTDTNPTLPSSQRPVRASSGKQNRSWSWPEVVGGGGSEVNYLRNKILQ